MSDKYDAIERFLASAQGRLNLLRWWAVSRAILLGGAIVMLLGAVIFVMRGQQVAGWWYLAVFAVVLIAMAAWAAAGRLGVRAASKRVDSIFNLHDAISSYLGFRDKGKAGGFYDLQVAATAKAVAQLDVKSIHIPPSKRIVAAAAVMLLAALSLGLKGPSQSVLDAMAEADRLAAETQQINEELKDLVEELIKEAEEKEIELIDPSELRKWAEQLDAKDDLQEALRQYARFEKKLAEAEAKLSNREDEDLLSEAGEKLQSDPQAKELGEKLTEKDYRAAEEELAELKPTEAEEMKEAEKELARLRAASKQLAAAARAQDKRRQGGDSGSGRDGKESSAGERGSQSSSGEQGDAQESSSPSSSSAGAGKEGKLGEQPSAGGREEKSRDGRRSLSQMMKEIDDASAEYERALSQYQRGESESRDELSQAQMSAGRSLDEMRDRLRQMAGSRELRNRLGAMRSQLAQRQGGLSQAAGQSPAMSRTQQQGKNGSGVGAGPGSNEPEDVSPDTGQVTTLEGIKGEGPSLTSIEDADSGSGSSGSNSKQRQLEFRHQVESFVHREDVPTPVRKGVQRYFENIHQPEE